MSHSHSARTYRCGVLTVSDRGASGARADTSGPALAELLGRHGFAVTTTATVPDDIPEIRRILLEWTGQERLDLILTTGGTGLSPRDLTPEATHPLLEREIPGIPEAMRQAGLSHTPHAMLSRGLAGTRGRSLIINLPGSAKAATENLATVISALPHAIDKLQGDPRDCGR